MRLARRALPALMVALGLSSVLLLRFLLPLLSSSSCLAGNDNQFFIRSGQLDVPPPATPIQSSIGSKPNAATGAIFAGTKVRSWTKSRLFSKSLSEQPAKRGIFTWKKKDQQTCSKWAVVTTIQGPTDSIRAVSEMSGWCLVVVGDTKTPYDYLEQAGFEKRSDIVFLSVHDQIQFSHQFIKKIPFKSFARKNIGYLFAIAHGAQQIFEFDDDNVLKSVAQDHSKNFLFVPLIDEANRTSSEVLLRYVSSNDGSTTTGNLTGAFNPYPYMNPSVNGTWPRGFPLQNLQFGQDRDSKSRLPVSYGSIPLASVGVIQSVCDHDPDVDAVYRLTRQLPFTFDERPIASKVLVPPKSYAPYNAQATVHMYKTFWGLLLPMTVTGRVSDIWRSYFVQRIMHDLNLALVFSPPLVVHKRNSHDYIADMQAEQDLYMKGKALISFLENYLTVGESVASKVEALWIALYEHNFIEFDDVVLMQLWLQALHDLGYEFPTSEIKAGQSELVPTEQPMLHDQPYLATPSFNVGSGGLTYKQFLTEKSTAGSPVLWKQWLDEVPADKIESPPEAVLKLIMMTKDEWPLIQQWTLYHGELVGFHNLYILDGSSDSKCISFLKYARDALGANVIFTPANLNGLKDELTEVGHAVAGASHFMIKMDTDEFLTAKGNSTKCVGETGVSDGGVPWDCTLSPRFVQPYLRDIMMDFSTFIDGRRLKVGYVSNSIPNMDLCSSGQFDKIEKFPMQPAAPTTFKTLSDSRAFNGFDLGGHRGLFLQPHKSKTEKPTMFGILHYHYRCFSTEVENNRKAVVSHGYVSDPDNLAKSLEELKQFTGPNPCDLKSPSEMLKSTAHSRHKILAYAQFLECPSKLEATFYPPDGSTSGRNHDFSVYLKHAISKYGFSNNSD